MGTHRGAAPPVGARPGGSRRWASVGTVGRGSAGEPGARLLRGPLGGGSRLQGERWVRRLAPRERRSGWVRWGAVGGGGSGGDGGWERWGRWVPTVPTSGHRGRSGVMSGAEQSISFALWILDQIGRGTEDGLRRRLLVPYDQSTMVWMGVWPCCAARDPGCHLRPSRQSHPCSHRS